MITVRHSVNDDTRTGLVRGFPRRLTSWGILNNTLLFKNNRILFSVLFSGDFCGEGIRLQ